MQESTVHQFNPDMAPDSAFVPGALEYLFVGNRGRWMDPRRTPFHLVALDPHTGHFFIEIDDFEDRGARLEIPFEQVTSYQIARGSAEASPADVLQLTEIVARFDRPLQIPCDSEATARTQRALRERQAVISTWLSAHSTFLKRDASLDTGTRRGSRELALGGDCGDPSCSSELETIVDEVIVERLSPDRPHQQTVACGNPLAV